MAQCTAKAKPSPTSSAAGRAPRPFPDTGMAAAATSTGASTKSSTTKPPSGIRTDSLADVLASIDGLAQEEQHLHLFVYLPYRHWQTSVIDEPVFASDFFPAYEGWRACWLRPVRVQKPDLLSYQVLTVELVFHNSTRTWAYLTRAGKLLVERAPSAPYRGVVPNPRTTNNQLCAISVSRLLTVQEIQSQLRGVIYGSMTPEMNKRKVLNIIRSVDDNTWEVFKIPPTCTANRKMQLQTVFIRKDIMNKYVPQTVQEFQHRHKPQLNKESAATLKQYLRALITQANNADAAAREAFTPVQMQDTNPKKELKLFSSKLQKLKQVVKILDSNL